MSFTLREIYEYAKGIRKRRAVEENHIRKFAYLFASTNRDPKKSFPSVSDFWPIPVIDGLTRNDFGTPQENEEIKRKLLEAWQLKSLN